MDLSVALAGLGFWALMALNIYRQYGRGSVSEDQPKPPETWLRGATARVAKLHCKDKTQQEVDACMRDPAAFCLCCADAEAVWVQINKDVATVGPGPLEGGGQ